MAAAVAPPFVDAARSCPRLGVVTAMGFLLVMAPLSAASE
jgi:hypothetical protein